jgi:hypothetical protein
MISMPTLPVGRAPLRIAYPMKFLSHRLTPQQQRKRKPMRLSLNHHLLFTNISALCGSRLSRKSKNMVGRNAMTAGTSGIGQNILYLHSTTQPKQGYNLTACVPEMFSYGYPLIYLEHQIHSSVFVGVRYQRMVSVYLFLWMILSHWPNQGYRDDPIARRVKNFPSDYFLLTNRFRCNGRRANDTGCCLNFMGNDPHILAQLPRFVSAAFPGNPILILHSTILNLVSSLLECMWCN